MEQGNPLCFAYNEKVSTVLYHIRPMVILQRKFNVTQNAFFFLNQQHFQGTKPAATFSRDKTNSNIFKGQNQHQHFQGTKPTATFSRDKKQNCIN